MRPTLVLLAVAMALAACHHAAETESDAAPGSDGDVDADADADADADVDGDADSDTGIATDCPMNSGWPCTCNQADCENDDICVGVQGMGDGTAGFCTHQCTDDGDCTEFFDGQGSCELTGDEVTFYCGLFCTDGDDCPSDQECQFAPIVDGSICHP
jgi:hypothetical protein